jgi:hypothetical protein
VDKTAAERQAAFRKRMRARGFRFHVKKAEELGGEKERGGPREGAGGAQRAISGL